MTVQRGSRQATRRGSGQAVHVKICGIRTPEDARVAADAGADFIGLVFTDSPRRVSVDEAQRIIAAFGAHRRDRSLDLSGPASRGSRTTVDAAAVTLGPFEALFAAGRLLFVGVFGDEPAEEIARTAQAAGVDVVQLSGRHAAAQAKALAHHPLIVAFRPDSGAGLDELPKTVLPLFDAPHATKLGGTGLRVDAALAARCAALRPVMLAGGLTPENVSEVILAVRPWGVDVSSGVETDGVKDHTKIRAFVVAAKAVAGGALDRSIALYPRESAKNSARTDRPLGLSATGRAVSYPKRRSSPRLPSFDYAGSYAYNVSISTAGGADAFRSAEVVSDCLQVLQIASERRQFVVHAYCFMPDHLHLLLGGSEHSSLIDFMKLFKQLSSYRYQKRAGRVLWHRSYYDHVLRNEESIQSVAEYIWNNPVRAGLVNDRLAYPFLGPREVEADSTTDRPSGLSVQVRRE